MIRACFLSASIALFTSAAHAQDAAPRQYKLQQPELVEQMRHLKPVASLQPIEQQVKVIGTQVLQCWKPSATTMQKGLVVVLRIGYNPDGSVDTVGLAENQAKLMEDNDFRLSVKNAIDATKQCSPLKNVAAIPYDQWREIEIAFDPSPAPAEGAVSVQQ